MWKIRASGWVRYFQEGTVESAKAIVASMGLTDFAQLGPEHVVQRINETTSATYAQLYTWLEPGSLIDGTAPDDWCDAWARASSAHFVTPKKQHPRPAQV